MYGYCTQFVVEAEGLDVDDLRVVMNDIAGSTVVIGDGSRAMVHGHAEDPGRLISMGIGIGALSKVKIENMDAQHADFASERRVEEPERREARRSSRLPGERASKKCSAIRARPTWSPAATP